MAFPSRAKLPVVALMILLTGEGLLFADDGAAHQSPLSPPISMGTSGGNASDAASYCCSGTLGALVFKNNRYYVLSASHVFSRNDQASMGEAIIQPGLVDVNCSASAAQLVATFSEAPGLGTGNVDAAIAEIQPGMVDTRGIILDIGIPAQTPAVPAVHQDVAKSGRTTGLTCDSITAIDLDVNVQYQTQCGGGTVYILSYTNQVLINSPKFSAAGDSGSLIVDANTAQPVALLFAGSSTTTVGNPIQPVMSQLQVQLIGGSEHAVQCPAKGKRTRPRAQAVANARAAKQRHAQGLMTDPAVIAVGVGASDSDPSQAAVVVYVEEGRAHRSIPVLLDGVPTQVIRTDRIRAYGWNEPRGRACSAN